MTERELLQIHMECMFTYEKDKMVYVNEPWGSTALAPLLFAGKTVHGEIVYRFGRQAEEDFIQKAMELLHSGVWDVSAYLEKLGVNRFSRELCFYYLPHQKVPASGCCLLDSGGAALFEASFRDCIDEIPFAQPYVGVINNRRLVSICRSVRKAIAGHEAGIETICGFRRQGFGLESLYGWTSAMQE